MTATLTPDRRTTATPDRAPHRHTAHCWWDVERARWVCDPTPGG